MSSLAQVTDAKELLNNNVRVNSPTLINTFKQACGTDISVVIPKADLFSIFNYTGSLGYKFNLFADEGQDFPDAPEDGWDANYMLHYKPLQELHTGSTRTLHSTSLKLNNEQELVKEKDKLTSSVVIPAAKSLAYFIYQYLQGSYNHIINRPIPVLFLNKEPVGCGPEMSFPYNSMVTFSKVHEPLDFTDAALMDKHIKMGLFKHAFSVSYPVSMLSDLFYSTRGKPYIGGVVDSNLIDGIVHNTTNMILLKRLGFGAAEFSNTVYNLLQHNGIEPSLEAGYADISI